MSHELPRVPLPLDAVQLLFLTKHLEFLRLARVGDSVTHDDGSVEKNGQGFILRALNLLTADLETHGFMQRAITAR